MTTVTWICPILHLEGSKIKEQSHGALLSASVGVTSPHGGAGVLFQGNVRNQTHLLEFIVNTEVPSPK